MNALSCARVEEHLDLYTAGECDPATRAAVERHLAGCPTCAAAAAEALRLQGLLDWHGQGPAVLQGLRGKIDKEERRMRKRRRVLPFVARLTAAAALVLLTLALLQMANPPGGGPTEEVVTALVLRSERGGPAPPGGVENIGPRGVAEMAQANDPRRLKQEEPLSFSLDRRGRTAQEYRQGLKDAARADALPAPPTLNLSLELSNPGPTERTLYLNAEETEFSLDLRGPGVLRVRPRAGVAAPIFPDVMRLAPGRQKELPIHRLTDGRPRHLENIYWTEAGDYTLAMRLRVPYSDGASARRRFITYESPPVHIKVVETR
jgi:hypothetical protein